MCASDNDCGSELATEATGVSASCDEWRSSLDGSDAAGLCMSMDADHDGYGSCISSRVLESCNKDGAAACYSLGVDSATCETFEELRPIQGGEWRSPAPEVLEEAYGPVIRLLGPGESFGELAMLSKDATRTATVIVGSPFVGTAAGEGSVLGNAKEGVTVGQHPSAALLPVEQATSSQGGAVATGGAAAASGATLIRISRTCYDATVRSLQVGMLGSIQTVHDLLVTLLQQL